MNLINIYINEIANFCVNKTRNILICKASYSEPEIIFSFLRFKIVKLKLQS